MSEEKQQRIYDYLMAQFLDAEKGSDDERWYLFSMTFMFEQIHGLDCRF